MTDFETINSELNVFRVTVLQRYVRQEFDNETLLYAKYDFINFARQLHLSFDFIEKMLEDYNQQAQKKQNQIQHQ